jgi:group II intron reverse transcriptase/maturase
MNGTRKSDGIMVPTKPPNATTHGPKLEDGAPYTGTKAETPETDKRSPKSALREGHAYAEVVEGRVPAEGNANGPAAHRTQRRESAPSGLDRVREAAKKDRKGRFTALFHHVTVDRLRAAFYRVRRRASPGVDGVMWGQYEAGLEANLEDLHSRLHRGVYRAKPSRRAYIPKADGRLRPLGVASLEDKIVQGAVVEVLNAIYETDFLGFSYGFRPERGQHDALDALATGLWRMKVNWVLDADIRGFFDAIDHGWLIKFIEHRIGDRRILRLIRKWLSAGVMEKGKWSETTDGTPQGATISPLLANVYLHYAFDLWLDAWRRRHARGDVIVVRYADDFVVGFQYHEDARAFLHELRKRLERFALELHPEKTRLIEFGRYARERRRAAEKGKPETFDFLGFTHICGTTSKDEPLLYRRTIKKRLRAKLREVKTEIMRRRHLSIKGSGQVAWVGGTRIPCVSRGPNEHALDPGVSAGSHAALAPGVAPARTA